MSGNLGPVVQSIVSLSKSLIKNLLSLTVFTRSTEAIFFAGKIVRSFYTTALKNAKLHSKRHPTALKKAKIVCNFGHSECNRVKQGVGGIYLGKEVGVFITAMAFIWINTVYVLTFSQLNNL